MFGFGKNSLTKLKARKNRALSVFKTTRDELNVVISDTKTEVANGHLAIGALEKAIKTEQANMIALEAEKTAMLGTVEQINKILNPSK